MASGRSPRFARGGSAAWPERASASERAPPPALGLSSCRASIPIFCSTRPTQPQQDQKLTPSTMPPIPWPTFHDSRPNKKRDGQNRLRTGSVLTGPQPAGGGGRNPSHRGLWGSPLGLAQREDVPGEVPVREVRTPAVPVESVVVSRWQQPAPRAAGHVFVHQVFAPHRREDGTGPRSLTCGERGWCPSPGYMPDGAAPGVRRPVRDVVQAVRVIGAGRAGRCSRGG